MRHVQHVADLGVGQGRIEGHEAQQLLVTRDFTPTNMKVRPLDVPFSVIDPAQILDQGDRWTKLYDEIVVKQGKKW